MEVSFFFCPLCAARSLAIVYTSARIISASHYGIIRLSTPDLPAARRRAPKRTQHNRARRHPYCELSALPFSPRHGRTRTPYNMRAARRPARSHRDLALQGFTHSPARALPICAEQPARCLAPPNEIPRRERAALRQRTSYMHPDHEVQLVGPHQTSRATLGLSRCSTSEPDHAGSRDRSTSQRRQVCSRPPWAASRATLRRLRRGHRHPSQARHPSSWRSPCCL